MKYLVDANLLVLLAVGLARDSAIRGHRKLDAYSKRDFERLVAILGLGSGLTISAYAFAEASSLAVFRIRDPLRSEIRAMIKALIDANVETHIACAAAAARPEFRWLGLADAALIERCDEDCVLLTADASLAAAAIAAGKSAMHFAAEARG